MLFNGERIGDGSPPKADIAVDPIDGTTPTALGRGGALAVIAVSEQGTMFDPGPCVYMEKLAVGPRAVGSIDIAMPIEDNLKAVAKAKGTSVRDLTVVILDRPRHGELIASVRETGARIRLITDGDVAGAIATALAGYGGRSSHRHRRDPRRRHRRRGPQVDGRRDPGSPLAPRPRRAAGGRRRRLRRRRGPDHRRSRPGGQLLLRRHRDHRRRAPPGRALSTSSAPPPSRWSCGPSRARSGSSTPSTRSTSWPSTAPSSSADRCPARARPRAAVGAPPLLGEAQEPLPAPLVTLGHPAPLGVLAGLLELLLGRSAGVLAGRPRPGRRRGGPPRPAAARGCQPTWR